MSELNQKQNGFRLLCLPKSLNFHLMKKKVRRWAVCRIDTLGSGAVVYGGVLASLGGERWGWLFGL